MNDGIYKIPLIYADYHSFSVLNSIFLPYLTGRYIMLSINVIERLIPGRTAGYKAGEFDMLQQSFFFVFYAKKRDKTNDGA